MFHARVSTVWSTSVGAERAALETSYRELSEDLWFGIGALLVVEESILENRPRGV